MEWHLCEHEWEERTDSQFSNDLFTEVVCSKCGCPGERSADGSVYWPAT